MALGFDVQSDEEPEGLQRAAKISSMDKMPKTPDFSEKMVPVKRSSPFVLDDFGGSNAYKGTKP